LQHGNVSSIVSVERGFTVGISTGLEGDSLELKEGPEKRRRGCGTQQGARERG